MAIEKYLTPEFIFDPTPSYDCMWDFDLSSLFNLAIRTNGKETKFHEFYRDTFIKPLSKIFNSEVIISFPMGMASMPNESKIGRKLTYSKRYFFSGLLGFLSQQMDIGQESPEAYFQKLVDIFRSKIEGNYEELNLAFAKLFKEKCQRLQDLIDNEIESVYFDAAQKDYALSKNDIDFRTYLKNLYRNISKIYNGLLNLGNFFEQPLDYHKLAECFDPDVFYLMFAKLIYEFNLKRESNEKTLDNSYYFLYNYEKAVRYVVEENRKYNPEIVFTLENGKRIHYSRWTFRDEFLKMQQRHPEIKPILLPKLDEKEANKYRDITIMEKIYKLLAGENFETNWELLPKSVDFKTSGVKKSTIKRRVKQSEKDIDTLRCEVDERIKIIKGLGYLICIKGKNSFTGYYAFVFGTGAVVLEKFWSDEEKLTPAKEEATFIMNIDNFIEMSKWPKLKLIEFIKNFPDSGIKRRYHTSVNAWHNSIFKAINDESYKLEDILRFTDRLKKDGEERKRTNE